MAGGVRVGGRWVRRVEVRVVRVVGGGRGVGGRSAREAVMRAATVVRSRGSDMVVVVGELEEMEGVVFEVGFEVLTEGL